MVDLFIDLVAPFLLYIFFLSFSFPYSLFQSVYVYASLCDFVCIGLLLLFVLGFCPFFSRSFLSIVFSACYHWWISFGLVALFFAFLFFTS